MYNKVILVGNLTREPELRYLPSGSAVCNTAIATNRRFKAQNGEQKEEVCFIDITLFGRTAEVANQYLNKGSKVLIEGRLRLEQWSDQSGQKRSKHTVSVETLQMLDTKNQSYSNQNEEDYTPTQQNQNNYYKNSQSDYNKNINNSYKHQTNDEIPEIDIDDDQIPF